MVCLSVCKCVCKDVMSLGGGGLVWVMWLKCGCVREVDVELWLKLSLE